MNTYINLVHKSPLIRTHFLIDLFIFLQFMNLLSPLGFGLIDFVL